MAIVTTNANIITGSATNSLGTLGRSVFNSTIGTFADKDTMDQIYKTIDKLNSEVETVDKTFDIEAFSGRNKADDLFAILIGLDIKNSSDFMNKNREFMKRLMRLNKQEKDITLDAIGVDATGISNLVRNEYVRNYNHVKGNDYYEDYVKTLPHNQQIGDETTTLQLESSNHFNYSGLHNDLYVVNKNLYPDDENKGTFANKWIVENRNSLMYKTKKLFNSKKVNTIISRFHTNPNRRPSLLDNARSKYGLSHGRNLLTKTAENGYNSSYVNGYDNPYCRVWTHHHQYDRYYKTIRPFSTIDDQGNYVETIGVEEFHKWKQFSQDRDTNGNKDEVNNPWWGWKSEENNGWKYSVLQDNGKVNITPKYLGGESKNIHTKQCMFSIENLAWRGYDPYSFEQALSWEQRGPLGGRIMWFPPYGIQFSETTSTQWSNNTFLGRGEDVYTYTNTTRTGQLSFMMVVDHPSILDYVAWTNENRNVTDTDILRFLAGCGEGDGGGLRDLAKPTPLTDEYTQEKKKVDAEVKEEEVPVIKEEKPIEKVIPTPPPPEIEKPVDKIMCFYVFYPNNYSGTYDDPYGGEGHNIDQKSKVEAIPYLLAGSGAQKNGNKYNTSFEDDIEINANVGHNGNGYEMDGNGLGKGNGYLVGTIMFANSQTNGNVDFWGSLGSSRHPRSEKYSSGVVDESKRRKWYYRIDGRYVYPQNSMEEKMHYYNQKLSGNSSYVDDNSLGLNKQISTVASYFSDQIEEKDGKYCIKGNEDSQVFTLAEVASVLYEGKSDGLKSKCGIEESERIKSLKEILKKEIKSINAVGFASAHGYVESNQILAKHRAETAAHWFINLINSSIKPSINYESLENNIGNKSLTDKQEGALVNGGDGGENKDNAKKWRYAKVIVEFNVADKKDVPTSEYDNTTETPEELHDRLEQEKDEENAENEYDNTTETPEELHDRLERENLRNNQGGKSYVGFNPTGEKGLYKGTECDIYLDSKKKKWYLTYENGQPKFVSLDYYASEEDNPPKARYGNGKTDENRLRYDQEYHFFKVLKQTDPVVYGSLMDKLQYFDPAFHSMTPEGFNGRLTFLQQCMRQGNTVSASDGIFAKTANNLAFGRAPYCVLRLGDFYNQMIVIDNLSISYDPLVWDLNVEGIGVQPLIAHVQLSFKFIGGGDLTGPVRRLQNAMSFNYYANARLYDNRADRIERKWSDKTCGAIEHDEILGNDDKQSDNFKNTYMKDAESSQFYSTKMYQ